MAPFTRRLSAEKLRDLARTGAEVTLKHLHAEIIAIERTFPELALPRRRRALRRSVYAGSESHAQDIRRGSCRCVQAHDAGIGRNAGKRRQS